MPTWSTATDWDSPQSELGVHHEQPTGTDWAAADVIEKGNPADWSNSTLPAPTHYWPFDEDSGTTATDVVGAQDGTNNGATVGAAGVGGFTGYDFIDADTDYVDISGWGFGDEPITMSAWVNFDALSSTYEIFFLGDGAPQFEVQYNSGDASTNFFYWDGSAARGDIKIADSNFSSGEWHLWTATFDTNGDFALYLDDGAVSATATDDVTIGANGSSNRIGDHPSNAWTVAGTIDEPMIWVGTALTQSQVTDLYNTFAGPSTYTSSIKSL